MGNGRRGRSAGIALGSACVLLLAGSLLLESGYRRYAHQAGSPGPSPSSTPGFTIPGFTLSRLTGASLASKTQLKAHLETPDPHAILGQLPLIFEENQGQAGAGVKFLARGAGYTLFLNSTDAVLALRGGPKSTSNSGEQFVRMKLVGANANTVKQGTDLLPGKSNYMIGNDPQRWHSGIPQYASVRYASVYPGIDLVFYGSQGNLEYDFKVAPGSDPAQAELEFDGASDVKLSGGDLILTAGKSGLLRLQAPKIYQREGDRRQPIAGHFALRANHRVGFVIGPYDHSRELVIDPVLKFSSYFGGTGAVSSPSIAVNGNGFIYVAGSTTSASGFPLNGTPSTQIGPGADIFVAEINPSQPPSVVYMTFLGGSGTDTSVGIGVDNGGKAYIVGNTTSPDFPTSGTNVLGYQTAPAAKGTQCASITCSSVFVSVLGASGAAPLSYSSYLSGNGNDQATAMTTDLSGDVFITGTTTSNDVPSISDAFPATFLPVPFQTQPVSTVQFFVTKVNTSIPSTGGIAYSTYFGGGTPVPPIASGGGIAVDSTGNIYFSGTTNFFNSGSGQFGDSGQSEDFPILNAYQPCLDTIPPTVLTSVNPCTAPAAPYPTDAFVAKLNPNGAAGTQLLFSTYLGGIATDGSTAIAIDSGAANIYITGSTNSSDFVLPTGTGAYQSCLNVPPPNVLPCPVVAGTDAFLARLSNPTVSTTGTPNNVSLTYFSYLGGSGDDSGLALAVLNSSTASLGDALVTGTTNSTNFPVTVGAIQSQLGAGATQNAFFAQIDTTTTVGNNGVGSYVTYFGGNGLDRGTSLAVDPNQNSYLAGDTTSTNLQVVNSLPGAGGTTLSGSKDAFVVKLGSATDLCITCVAPTLSSAIVSAGNSVSVTFTVTNEGPDPATNINVTGSISSGMTFNTATAGSGTCSTPSGVTAVCTIPTLQSGSASTVVFGVTPSSNGNYSVTAQVSNSNNTNSVNSTTASFTAGAFSMSVNPPAQSVRAGVTTAYSVQLSPNQVFSAPISLTCGSLPGGASCNFAPSSSITLNGPQSVTLNLATTPQPVNIASLGLRSPFSALWLLLPGMAVLGLGTRRLGARGKSRGHISRLLALLLLSLFFALILFQPACSGSKTPATVSGTPSGTYQLTVTATSGTFSRSAPFSVTVSP